MSVSYNAGVILGVSLADLGFKIEPIVNKYEIHDRKGKPTGKFDTEKTFKLSFQGKEKIVYDVYLEDVEEMIGLNSPLKLFQNDYNHYEKIETYTVGIQVVSNGYDEWNVLKEIPQDSFSTVFNSLESQFEMSKNGFIHIKYFFYFNAG